MFALHWICALTLALISCLSAQPVKRNAKERLTLISNFQESIEEAKCADNMSLYSPVNIKEDCMSSALNCTIEQLNVLGSNCSITDDEDFVNLLTMLTQSQKKGTWKLPATSSPDCICEKQYNKTDVKKFLENMKAQVERLNSRV